MPPRISKEARLPESAAAGSAACSISGTLPAVPTLSDTDSSPSPPGSKSTSREPIRAPFVRAPHARASTLRAAACCAPRPGLFLPALMSVILTGEPETAESAAERRSTCPPPSPELPSMRIGSNAAAPLRHAL